MFQNSNPIFEFRGPFGVPVQIGSSLIFLILIFVSLGQSSGDMLTQMIFLGLLVVSIFLHELGHAWGCLVQGVPVRRIMIHGGGGFCQHAGGTTPYQEELIVAMGPIVNLAIWAIASLVAGQLEFGYLAWGLSLLAYINLFLGLFNLLPVLPLDGGRLFHLALLRVMSPPMATKLAGGVGVVMAVVWIPMMIFLYLQMGFVLLFFPPIRLHWQMLRS